MNPALPLLAAVPLVAFAVARRRQSEWAWAVGWTSLFALLLLSPILAAPDGVPSGTALLDRLAPWKQDGAPPSTSVNPEQNDLPYQVETRLLFLRDEVRSGRPGFWNPYAFGGYPQWSAIQVAPLSPWTWLYLALPLDFALHLLPFLRFVVAGLGAFLFARELGAGRAGALLAAATFAFSGRTVSFVLYPLGSAIALIPWVLLGVERIGRGAAGTLLLAAASALQWTSGHPETAAFTGAAAAVWLLLRAGFAPRAWARLFAGGGVAVLLAGATLLPFLHLLPQTLRYSDYLAEKPLPPVDQAAVLLRFLLPDAFGDPTAGTAFGRLPYVATLLYSGAFLLPLAIVALAALRSDRDVRRLGLFALLATVVSLSFPGVHHLFLMLPVLKRGIAHYYLSFAILAVAVLAALGLERLAQESRRRLLWTAAATAGALAAAWVALGGEWQARGLVAPNAARAALVVAVPLALAALAARGSLIDRRGVRWALVLVAATELVLAHRGEIPLSRRGDLYPERPALALLAARDDGRVLGPRWVMPANTATPYRIHDLRGADSVTPSPGAAALGRWLAGDEPQGPLPAEERARLDRWSVRYWLIAPGGSPPEEDARLLHDGADARVYERASSLPVVRFEEETAVAGAAARLEVVERRPGRWTIDWASGTRRVLSVADAYDRGWRAFDGGRELAVDGADPLRLRVAVGPGEGRLTLAYRPHGLVPGVVASLVGLVALLFVARLDRRASRAFPPRGAYPAAP